MEATMDRIILQSDWDHVLWENRGEAWVTYKGSNSPGVHGHINTEGISREGLPYMLGSNGFSIASVTKKSITVGYNGAQGTLSRKFVAPQKRFLKIHQKAVACLDVTSGGLGVSCDTDHKLRIWQTSDGEVRRELAGHVADVYTCRFFPSGIVVLSGGADMLLKIWSAETGKCAVTLTGHTSGILDTAIVDKGRNVVSCGKDGTAKLWDVGNQSCLTTFNECNGIVNACSLHITDNSIDLGTPNSPSSEREVSTEGTMLLLACENSTLQGYGLRSRTKIFELDCHGPVNTCAFLTDVSAVCGTQDGHITIVDLRNVRVPVKEWKESRSAVLSLLPYKQGFFVSTGDGSCFYVDERLECLAELTGSDCDPVYRTVCDGTHVYTACRDGAIRKYNLTNM
ncbi:proteasomal ATPase-associated factor 1-like isoform X2 [Gigantopelta aegis]|uniref:proteasomal ATPase-associated factor 1-like isoform X2 n=1 Tax=Gigantopelta aegis TaxID=1735272 RepID=UPI001B88CE3D|nr:proteasomal ATPase-associated factor 1-like isoform X2 [Gigantopelta aegis]